MKMRLFFLPVVATVFSCLLTGPVRADKVADGSVNFTGILLGKETCTLVSSALNVDFGTLSVDSGAMPDVLASRPVAFHFTNCPSMTQRILMTVSFTPFYHEDSIINDGLADVTGSLACSNLGDMAHAGVFGCPVGNIQNGGRLSGVVHNDRTLYFPLIVSLHPIKVGKFASGTVNMTVNFTFEEM
ncbi:type 1 fimbrial protein [Salmonella enterica subsp. enterica serovar Manhattan]|nr:type 1 fimbrial protein [Salmonella enterica subsp. enterica serovar Manhattan]EDP8881145.1 type 1 fimbrial protein [Salmonella enterica subsp. enterica]ELK1656953.1 type 1 fimbrial protein [Salmonella enterica]EBF8146408.1 type 1 fimbrial protein [Salmonella enterica subsp. enterica serovar Manhattan]EBU8490560.1 type 1 fimbrial protein [Salmonella enterica subsp. enterica serovar Manhattan]